MAIGMINTSLPFISLLRICKFLYGCLHIQTAVTFKASAEFVSFAKFFSKDIPPKCNNSASFSDQSEYSIIRNNAIIAVQSELLLKGVRVWEVYKAQTELARAKLKEVISKFANFFKLFYCVFPIPFIIVISNYNFIIIYIIIIIVIPIIVTIIINML